MFTRYKISLKPNGLRGKYFMAQPHNGMIVGGVEKSFDAFERGLRKF